MVILLYTNFNNISVISRWFAALVDETEVRWENNIDMPQDIHKKSLKIPKQ